MKRKDVIKHLNSNKCVLKREGGSHSVYLIPLMGRCQRYHDIMKSMITS